MTINISINLIYVTMIHSVQYVGTFPVHSGLGFNSEGTLESHKSRTRFVKEKLVDYRVSIN